MILIECEQGSDEWHEARAGVITASMFSTIRTKVGGLSAQQQLYVDAIREGKSEAEAIAIAQYKTKPRITEKVEMAIEGKPIGEYSDAAKDYGFRLAVERISRVPLDEGFSTWAMRRGNEMEEEARMRHEEKEGILVERAGFVITDDRLFGASADGLIDEDGGSEYKCLVSPSRLRKIIVDKDISEFTDQVQGCMWVTGRRYWHFALYCPALKEIGKDLTMVRVERDDDYIEELELELIEFNNYVEHCKAQIIEA